MPAYASGLLRPSTPRFSVFSRGFAKASSNPASAFHVVFVTGAEPKWATRGVWRLGVLQSFRLLLLATPGRPGGASSSRIGLSFRVLPDESISRIG
jgi:hypothetical protein